MVGDRFPNYSICGIPYYLSGEIDDWKKLAHRTSKNIENQGIELLLECLAEVLDISRKEVSFVNASGETGRLAYDRLVIAPGAVSVRPPIQDITLSGVFFLRWMRDAFEVNRWRSDRRPNSALVVGSG
jgi:NADPH-dependent 2,4-dienoyl-CoA reductase/sulfur reductase-like enzyme